MLGHIQIPLAIAFGAVGLWIGLFVAPTDAQQGDSYRIIFVHVPAAWMSMFVYVLMAGVLSFRPTGQFQEAWIITCAVS